VKKKLFVMLHPQFDYMNKYIHLEYPDDQPLEPWRNSVIAMAVAPTVIREATEEEKQAFIDNSGIYNSFAYPEQEGLIAVAIKAWNNPLPLDQILGIIMRESKDECRSSSGVIQYFREHYEYRFNPRQLRTLCDMLNFPAVREVQAERPGRAFQAPQE
jgi:hypothetical protein